MIKIYGMPTCPYCDYVHEQIKGREDEFEYINIGENIRNMSVFTRLRDTNPVFDHCKEIGDVGIPAFVFGMICTFWIKNNISQKFFFLIMFIGLPIFIYLYPFHHQIYNYKYLSIAFLLPLFVYIFILLSRNFRCLSPILRKMGNASLEIYLTQGIFFSLVLNGTIAKNSDWHDILSVLMIITSTFLGIIIHWLIDKSKILNMI